MAYATEANNVSLAMLKGREVTWMYASGDNARSAYTSQLDVKASENTLATHSFDCVLVVQTITSSSPAR